MAPAEKDNQDTKIVKIDNIIIRPIKSLANTISEETGWLVESIEEIKE